MWLFFAFVAIPLIEIALFVQVGGAIGLVPTLVVVVLTALVGTVLVRGQGLAVLRDLQHALRGGGNPAPLLAHGAMILAAGITLLTPGFFTDAVGLALLLPPVRAALIRYGAARFSGRVGVQVNHPETRPRDATVIDADYEPVEPEPAGRGQSGWTRPRG
ncbi:MAG: FxsA family protein [Pseudomonadota bacterium]